MSNCTGHCCDNFYTQYSPKEWARWSRAIKRSQKTFSLDNGTRKNVGTGKRDVLYIANMLILKKQSKKGKDKET